MIEYAEATVIVDHDGYRKGDRLYIPYVSPITPEHFERISKELDKAARVSWSIQDRENYLEDLYNGD